MSQKDLASAVYVGRVHHARHAPRPHRFSYRLFMLYLDLDEVEHAFDGRWLWSHERWNVASFRRKHFLGDPGRPLAECVRERVESALGEAPPRGPIRMLTHVALLGYCFNPVSFYYLFHEDGETLHSVTAEITNTPWKERHAYVMAASGPERPGEWRTWKFKKDFHVSPFFPMDHHYRWSFTTPLNEPGSPLRVAMENHAPADRGDAPTAAGDVPGGDATSRVFDAALELERRPLDGRELRRCLLRHPWMTGKVHAAIYWQALRLWLKRTPFFDHPSSAEA